MENTRDISMLDPPYPGLYGDSSPGNGTYAPEKDFGTLNLRAAQACTACRKQKRKCDKALPSCNLCQRMDRACDYSDSTPTPNADDFALLRKKVTDLEARLESQNTAFRGTPSLGSRGTDLSSRESPAADQISRFPSIFFLDAEMFHEGRMTVPRPDLPVPRDVGATLGSIVDIRDIVERYFENIHLWLPIVSKKRMQLALSNPRMDLPTDLAALLLCMKLITQNSHGSPEGAQTPLYHMAKRHVGLVESGALISLHLLQAILLIAVYEIGHAIYPAAYLTTGQSARLGHLMGLHDRHVTPQVLRRTGAWAEAEEIKRCWWACMLVDRYVSLGIDGRPLAAEDPSPQSVLHRGACVLPVEDASWDIGEMSSSEPLYVTSPTSLRAGAYARTCQATHLLGRLRRLLNDHSDDPLRYAEAAQLSRTIEALVKLLPDEVQHSPEQFCTPLALCYGALIHIYDPFCCTETNHGGAHCVEETEMQTIGIIGMKKTSADILQLADVLRTIMSKNLSAVSPLTLDALYMGASTVAWHAHESGSNQDIANYHALRELLVQMNTRWAAAGEYLKALDATKDILYPNDRHL